MYKSTLLPDTILEDTFRCTNFKQLLPADPDQDRHHDLVQFISDQGGLRTVRARDIVDISKR